MKTLQNGKGAGFWLGISLGLSCVALSACSPASMFGSGEDAAIARQPGYRRVNSACSGMDLARSELDPRSARQLVDCLNAQGALGGIARLVHSMKDDEIKPFVSFLNRSLLQRPKLLFSLERTYNDLEEQKTLVPTLSSLGQLLKNPELIQRSLKLLRKSYLTDEGKADPALRHALSRLSLELSDEKVSGALDLGAVIGKARAFASLWERLTSSPAARERRLGPEVAQGLIDYARSGSDTGNQLLAHVANGDAFALADALVPEDAEAIRSLVPGWSSVIHVSMSDGARIARGMSALFEAIGKPVPCFQGARSMKHVARDMIRDLSELKDAQGRPSSRGAASFIQRERLLEIYLTQPLCAYPSELFTHYPALIDLSASPAIEPLVDVLRAAYEVGQGGHRPMADLLIDALGDPGFRLLLPALQEVGSRGGWEDALLLATVPRLADRTQVTELAGALSTPLTDTPGQPTPLDVFMQGLASADAAEVTDWLRSFQATDIGLGAVFDALRAAYAINGAHPVIQLARDALAELKTDPSLLEAMLKLSAHPHFGGALSELAEMSRDGDPRLRDLLATTLTLFHQHAARGYTSIEAAGPSRGVGLVSARHDLDSGLLGPWSGTGGVEYGACRAIDFSKPWNSADPAFDGQLPQVAACANVDGQYADLGEALKFLGSARVEGDASGRTVFSLVAQAYNSFRFTAAESRQLADWALAPVSDGRALRALRAIPIWVNTSMIEPLVNLAGPVARDLKARASLRALMAYGSTVLKREDFQAALTGIDDLIRGTPAASPTRRSPYDEARILRWIANKECASLPAPADAPAREAALRERLAQVTDEYENSAVPHAAREGGKLRQDWGTADLKAELEPIFKKFGDVKGNGPLIESLLRFTARFNDPKQYPKGYLEKWLRDRAMDRRLIGYLYPGEDRPRVRLVNGLDRLGLVLLNADIFAPEPLNMNFGMEFLAKIAQAWGDVPFAERPAEIREAFPEGTPVQTMAEAVAEIRDTANMFFNDLVGFPKLAECAQAADPADPKAVQDAELWNPSSPVQNDAPPGSDLASLQINMFNIAQTVAVLEENVQDGGLKVLRDLFFDLYFTGPAENRDSSAGLKNNLSVVIRLVKTGLLRQVGALLEASEPGNPRVTRFFSALLDGASTPETAAVFKALFIEDTERELIWSVMNEILALKDPAGIARAQAVGLNLMGGIDSLGKARDEGAAVNPLLKPAMASLAPILSQYRELLSRHTDLVGDLLKSEDVADLLSNLSVSRHPGKPALLDTALDALTDPSRGLKLMAVLETLDTDADARRNWDDFKVRFDALDQNAAYRALNLSEIGRQALNTVEGRAADGSPLSAEERALGRKALYQLGTALERDDALLGDQLLALAAKDPAQVNGLIRSLGKLVENGEASKFLDLIDRTLSKP